VTTAHVVQTLASHCTCKNCTHCPDRERKHPLIPHPDAILFLPISRKGVFQHPEDDFRFIGLVRSRTYQKGPTRPHRRSSDQPGLHYLGYLLA
jgi:hypothetical protein